MPYIESERRDALISYDTARTAGELNYKITKLLIEYVDAHTLTYQIINDIVGALEGAKAEFQRRVVAPYEDAKADTNGDLPWPSEA